MTPLRFEDLSHGQKLFTPDRTLREAEIIAFATRFDPQPMHTDKAEAERGPMGGLIASGWQTATVALALQREAGLQDAGVAAIAHLAWPKPVRPGDRVHAEIEVGRLEPDSNRPGHGVVHLETTLLTERGDAVLVMRASVFVPQRAAGSR